jgi:hypothetical protein
LFPPLQQLVDTWSQKEGKGLAEWWHSRIDSGQYTPPSQTEHEDIGLLMIGVLFGGHYETVSATCESWLGVKSSVFADDVRAMLVTDQRLKPSDHFIGCADEITKSISSAATINRETRAEDLLVWLHTLLSGTLDVDRLDYLVRDSRYTGVPYGICDVEVLINGLALVANPDEGNLVMALRARATRALDDLLWSRYQLFSQVLNHKTNVMLNALLADAIPEAMEESGIPLKRPRTFIDFVAFTDDLVMSSVLTACLRSEHEGKAYDRALVHRDLPLYLGRIDLPPVDHQQTASLTEQHEAIIEAAKIRFASEDLGKPSKAGNIRTWSVESALLKGGGMPYVLDHSKGLRRDILRAPAEPGTYQIVEWTKHKKLPAKVESCHFFIDRDQLNS